MKVRYGIFYTSPPSFKTEKQLRSLFSLTGYQKYTPFYASKTTCLSGLPRNNCPNTTNCNKSTQKCLNSWSRITSFPILRAPDFTHTFLVYSYTSMYATGAALLQIIPISLIWKLNLMSVGILSKRQNV